MHRRGALNMHHVTTECSKCVSVVNMIRDQMPLRMKEMITHFNMSISRPTHMLDSMFCLKCLETVKNALYFQFVQIMVNSFTPKHFCSLHLRLKLLAPKNLLFKKFFEGTVKSTRWGPFVFGFSPQTFISITHFWSAIINNYF